MPRILDTNEEQFVRESDKGVKEKWKWSWLEEDVEIKLPGKSGIADKVKYNLGEFARKVDILGKSMCTLCNKLINYGNHFDTVCILVLESEVNQNDIVIFYCLTPSLREYKRFCCPT